MKAVEKSMEERCQHNANDYQEYQSCKKGVKRSK